MREIISNRLSAVSIRDLLMVEAVAHHGGFRHAAAVIGISPSGLSHQIRKVEEILETSIFERGSQVTLTADGELVLEAITSTLESIARIETLRDGPNLPLGSVLRIGVISSLAPPDLVQLVELCSHHSPQTRVEIVSGKHQGLIRRLMDREIDLLITADTDFPDGLSHSDLLREGFILLVNPDLGVSNYVDLKCSKPGLLPISEDDFLPKTISAGVDELVNSSLTRAYGLSIEHRISLVSAGYGHALLPKGWVEGLSNNKANAIIELPEALSGQRTLRCVWRNSFVVGPHAAKLFQSGMNAQVN